MLLSDIDGEVCIDKVDNYWVKTGCAPFVLLKIGFKATSKLAQFDHKNLLGCNYVVHEFKHYPRNRHKCYTHKAGCNLYFAILKNKIHLVPEKTHSFPIIKIGKNIITLNASGGTIPEGGWTDYIGNQAATCIGIKKSTLKEIAKNAISITEAKKLGLTLNFNESYNYEKSQEEADERLKQEKHFMRKMVAKSIVGPLLQEKMVVYLIGHYSIQNSKGPFTIINRRCKSRSVAVSAGFYNQTDVFYKHVDWLKTAEANNIELPALQDVNRVPVLKDMQ